MISLISLQLTYSLTSLDRPSLTHNLIPLHVRHSLRASFILSLFYIRFNLDVELGLGVEGGRCLVEDHDAGLLEEGAGNGNPLLFAARQLQTALPHHGVVALWEALM